MPQVIRSAFAAKVYAVGFIDFMGHSAQLAKWSKIPENENEIKAFGDNLKRTVIPLLNFKEDLQNIFRLTHRPISGPSIGILKEDEANSWANAISEELKITQISDAFVAYSPIALSSDDFSPIPLYRILTTFAGLHAYYLAMGIPLRGGISIGPGIDSPDFNGFYGPSMAIAYKLESECAKYPRIIACDQVKKFVSCNRFCPEDAKNNFYRRIAGNCKKLLLSQNKVDMLDFASRACWPSGELEQRMGLYIKHGYVFSYSQFKKYDNVYDRKLRFYYENLTKYLRTRLPAWGLDANDLEYLADCGQIAVLTHPNKVSITSEPID